MTDILSVVWIFRWWVAFSFLAFELLRTVQWQKNSLHVFKFVGMYVKVGYVFACY